MLKGCLVCVICNTNSIHSFLFKLCIMIVHILKMCTFYFVHISGFLFLFLRGVEPRHFFHPKCLGVPSLCNAYIHSFSFKLCIMIVHILKMCTFYFVHISLFFSFLRGVELRHFSIRNA